MPRLRDGVIKRGGSWSYVIRVPDPATGARKPKWVGGFETEEDAKAARDEARVRARRGEYVNRSTSTVAGYLAEWLEAHASTARPGPSIALVPSATPSPDLAWRSGPACTPVKWNATARRSPGWRSMWAPGSPPSLPRAKSWSPAPCRCSSSARASPSPTGGTTPLRVCPTGGSCSRWTTPDRPLSRSPGAARRTTAACPAERPK
jgi:hypothetical protein